MKCSKTTGAVADLAGDAQHPKLRGHIRFLPHRSGVQVVAQICGLIRPMESRG